MNTMTRSKLHRGPSPDALAPALEYVQSLAQRGMNPLHLVLGDQIEPVALEQYPRPGINWIEGEELGYFYHSHAPDRAGQGAHGHFHLFSRVARRLNEALVEPYSHLVGIDVDATGMPLRLFTTNLWVTAGVLRPERYLRGELRRFAQLRLRSDCGPERWISLILSLFPQQVTEVLRLREQRLDHWRRKCVEPHRLADRRIRILSSLALQFEAV